MKRTNLNITKRPYHKPAIEEVVLDHAIVYMMGSPDGEDGGENEWGDDDDDVGGGVSPNYDSDTYKPAENPFGGSRPAW